MNLVGNSLSADLIRQAGYFVIDPEALMLKVSALQQHILFRYRFRLELPCVQYRYIIVVIGDRLNLSTKNRLKSQSTNLADSKVSRLL